MPVRYEASKSDTSRVGQAQGGISSQVVSQKIANNVVVGVRWFCDATILAELRAKHGASLPKI